MVKPQLIKKTSRIWCIRNRQNFITKNFNSICKNSQHAQNTPKQIFK